MDIATIRRTAYAMPLTSPSYPRGPYRYRGREYLTIAYRTDAAAIARAVPAPLRPVGDVARFQFIRMADSTGFGAYHGAAQLLDVTLPDGTAASYVVNMYLDTHPPIAGGRELWGFPQKLAAPSLTVAHDTLVGRLDVGPIAVARGSMGFKHREMAGDDATAALTRPGVLLKIVPHVDGSPRICELVRFSMSEVRLLGAWSGPAALSLHPHALAPVADLPVRAIVDASHMIADMTLGHGTVVHDYLASRSARP